MFTRRSAPALALIAALALSGCAAGYTAVAKRNLDVQTKMTDTVFLDPVAPAARTVFVEVRNTSDKPDLDIAQAVRSQIAAKGYRVVDDPDQAHYLLQANVLQAGRASETALESAYSGGFGGALLGGAAGGAAGYAIGRAGGGNDVLLGVGGALAGAAIETFAGAYMQDVTYSIVTDLQISERTRGGSISETTSSELHQGKRTTTTQSSSRTTDLRRYQTRVVSSANKANLAWEEAAPELVSGLGRSVAGIF
ncbi:complement resistance protein TraT [Geminicoccaceae bacterium 1502E]|nr:complement resistance protein TraT [Geminicoccaceae bacterium 1502E]